MTPGSLVVPAKLPSGHSGTGLGALSFTGHETPGHHDDTCIQRILSLLCHRGDLWAGVDIRRWELAKICPSNAFGAQGAAAEHFLWP